MATYELILTATSFFFVSMNIYSLACRAAFDSIVWLVQLLSLFVTTLFANDTGLLLFAWKPEVLLFMVSLATFLTDELVFLLYQYSKLKISLLRVAIFSLETSLLFIFNPLSFDIYGFDTLLDVLIFRCLMIIELSWVDVVLLIFVSQFFSNRLLD